MVCKSKEYVQSLWPHSLDTVLGTAKLDRSIGTESQGGDGDHHLPLCSVPAKAPSFQFSGAGDKGWEAALRHKKDIS